MSYFKTDYILVYFYYSISWLFNAFIVLCIMTTYSLMILFHLIFISFVEFKTFGKKICGLSTQGSKTERWHTLGQPRVHSEALPQAGEH